MDQRSVASMLDNRQRTKINNKIQCWQLELASHSYSIPYRPGKENVGPDALTRAFCANVSDSNLLEIHDGLCHPGVTRMLHSVGAKNLPYSMDDVKKVCTTCRAEHGRCAELKPRFYAPQEAKLVKATQPIERWGIDFKGPLPTSSRNILTVIDEFSRFPFAFACPDMQSTTVISCLDQLFSLCRMPGYKHSDNQTSFSSSDIKE